MLKIVLALLAAFAVSVQAQNPLQALAEHMPKCSLACFVQELPLSTCATKLTSACLCSNNALNLAVAACSKQTCTMYELLQTKNVTTAGCGAPVRVHGGDFTAIAIAGAAIAVAAFLLRMTASLGKHGRQVSWDDVTMAVVVALAIPPAVFAPYLVKNGLGRDIWTLTDVQITNVLYYYFLGEIFYVVALGISKISILFLYLRVFPAKNFRILTYSVMGLSAVYTIVFFIVTTWQCRPLSLAWTQWDGLHPGTCNDIHLQGWIAAAINIFLDIVVMVLPMKHLAALNMSLKKKLMVMSMFGVGIFVVVVSVIRLYSLIHFANTENITWNYVDAGMWSLIEIDVSIICGCMPAFRLLIAKMWPKIRSTIDASKGTSSKLSRFVETNNSVTGTTDKSARISVRPKGRDEDDFIALKDIDNDSDRAILTEHKHGERTSHTWITQTHTVEISREPASSKEQSADDRSQDWPMVIGKEHV
ncbi:hypothetical protein HBI53_038060 [Parastagonospora nodorum]|nr:hypothetical protein HBI53_038060 [Parastagonospora nodorum]